MAYLAEVQLPAASKNAADGSSTPAPEYGLTMRGHLANVGNGVGGLCRKHGANLSYHILGAASAEPHDSDLCLSGSRLYAPV